MEYNSSRFDDVIIITAARPRPWFREKFTPSYWARLFGESIISDYKEKMEHLRRIDDQIYDWTKDIQGILKNIMYVRKSVSKNDPTRLIDIAILLGSLNKKFRQIKEVGNYLEDITEEARKELEQKYKEELPEDGEHIYDLSPKEKEDLAQYKKEAGIKDLFRNKFYERLTRKKENQRRDAILKLIDNAADTVGYVQKKLKELGLARSSGRIGEYIDTLKDIGKKQEAFEAKFAKIYNEYLKELVEGAIKVEKEAKERLEKEKQDRIDNGIKEQGVGAEKVKDLLMRNPIEDESVPDTQPENLLQKQKMEEYWKEQVQNEGPKWDRPEAISFGPHTVPSPPVIDNKTHNPTSLEYDLTGPPKEKHKPSIPAAKPSTMPSAHLDMVNLEGKPSSGDLLKDLADVEKKKKKDEPVEISFGPGGTGTGPGGTSVRANIEQMLFNTKNKLFVSELKKVAVLDDPYLLGYMLLKHSEEIEEEDPESSLKLLAIAEGILG